MTRTFEEEKNTAALTLRSIMQAGKPILYVSHADGDWQFLSGETPRIADALVVRLEEIFQLDPTIAELANLPVDWEAWRNTPLEPWHLAQCQELEGDGD